MQTCCYFSFKTFLCCCDPPLNDTQSRYQSCCWSTLLMKSLHHSAVKSFWCECMQTRLLWGLTSFCWGCNLLSCLPGWSRTCTDGLTTVVYFSQSINERKCTKITETHRRSCLKSVLRFSAWYTELESPAPQYLLHSLNERHSPVFAQVFLLRHMMPVLCKHLNCDPAECH